MKKNIDFNKIVDIIDEGIMALSEVKQDIKLSDKIQTELMDILKFLIKASETNYNDLLYDKKISIDDRELNSIHKQLDVYDFSKEKIDATIKTLQDINKKPFEIAELNELQKSLLDLSIPIWNSHLTMNINE